MNKANKKWIFMCVKRVAPLDAEMIGDTTLNRIIDGSNYQDVDGGHFIDPSASIGLVSGVVTIAQALLAVGIWTHGKVEKKRIDGKSRKTSTIESVKKSLMEDAEISNLLTSRPELIAELYDILEDIDGAISDELR